MGRNEEIEAVKLGSTFSIRTPSFHPLFFSFCLHINIVSSIQPNNYKHEDDHKEDRSNVASRDDLSVLILPPAPVFLYEFIKSGGAINVGNVAIF